MRDEPRPTSRPSPPPPHPPRSLSHLLLQLPHEPPELALRLPRHEKLDVLVVVVVRLHPQALAEEGPQAAPGRALLGREVGVAAPVRDTGVAPPCAAVAVTGRIGVGIAAGGGVGVGGSRGGGDADRDVVAGAEAELEIVGADWARRERECEGGGEIGAAAQYSCLAGSSEPREVRRGARLEAQGGVEALQTAAADDRHAVAEDISLLQKGGREKKKRARCGDLRDQ